MPNRPRPHTYALATLLAITPYAAHADNAPKPAAITLAQALAQAAPPRSDVYIAVNADHVTLPKDAIPPSPGDTAAQAATAFGRKIDGFRNIDAIAPATIMVVNIPPDKPNIYDGMTPGQIVRLLAARFTKDEWRDFLSDKGVAYADLQSEEQRSLFDALFPDHKIKALPADAASFTDPTTDLGADQVRQARLRLAYKTGIALSTPGNPHDQLFANDYRPPGSPKVYYMMNTADQNVDHEYGADIRNTIPNTLKPSDLNDDDSAWKTEIELTGLRAVDDCARAISDGTGREIYADPRYAKLTVTILGPRTPVRAYDLMRALALCLGASWRQVGPAFVLTNDRVGLGVKHALWREFEEKAAAMMPSGPSYEALPQPEGSALNKKDIPFTADAVPFSPRQLEQYWKKMGAQNMMTTSDMLQLSMPFSELEPAQQEAARHIQEANTRDHLSSTLDGDVTLQAEAMVQVVVPALDGPVVITQSDSGLLPNPPMTDEDQAASAKLMDRIFAQQGVRPDTKTDTEDPPAAYARLVRTFERRAVLLDAHTPDEVDKELAAMASLGLNELWLRVSPTPTDKDEDAAVAWIRRAAKSATAAHIAFYPAFSILGWGDGTPNTLLDRTVLGRSAAQVRKDPSGGTRGIRDTVTPFAPEVPERLMALIGRVGRIPGVAGMAWSDLSAHGYESEAFFQDNEAALGYALAGRLASLRTVHIDPMDLYSKHYQGRTNISVPGFGDSDERDGALYDSWRILRADTGHAFLRAITAAVPPASTPGAPQIPIVLLPPAEEPSNQYGVWEDLAKPPPAMQFVPFIGDDGKPTSSGTERMSGRTVYWTVGFFIPKDGAVSEGAKNAVRTLKQYAHDKVRCIVFDQISPEELMAEASAITADVGD
ncbi:hypothetical protein CCAX7_56590 [Capsulimonas corticalis]|uniref:Uncharacterized protein n=1 Tax=Capsulimonas corticalis TaxID=2219043 RepID=A0A402D0I2_9BACT|nr:hypothetical protein [Capsulimonas corticalis]BDI33608.1 hypothetical protein CCAX7_56590 [Capsulimonas corticalis]